MRSGTFCSPRVKAIMDKQTEAAASRVAQSDCPISRRGIRCIEARELFAGERELRILHAGREYRLRVTQSGKLILTA